MTLGPPHDSDRFGIRPLKDRTHPDIAARKADWPDPILAPATRTRGQRARTLAWWATLYATGQMHERYKAAQWLESSGLNAFMVAKGEAPFVTLDEFEETRARLAKWFHAVKDLHAIPKTPLEALAVWQAPEAITHLLSFIARREQHPLRFLRWMRWLPWKGRVLEYGAGAAPFTHGVVTGWPLDGLDIVCADIDWVLRDYCRHRFRSEQRVSVVDCADVVGPFDGIVCTETLEHVPDPLLTARRLMEMLRPGGILIADYGEQTKNQPMAPKGASARTMTRNHLSLAGRVHRTRPFFVVEKT